MLLNNLVPIFIMMLYFKITYGPPQTFTNVAWVKLVLTNVILLNQRLLKVAMSNLRDVTVDIDYIISLPKVINVGIFSKLILWKTCSDIYKCCNK